MHHTLKIKDHKSLRNSEAAMAACDAAEKLKKAARAYCEAVPSDGSRGQDFNDASPEGKALLEAGRSYALWHDAMVTLRKKG